MNPAELRKHLAAYADGELEPALRQEIEADLATDVAASAEVQRWQALRQASRRALDREPVPAGLETRMRVVLHKPSGAGRARIYRFGLSGMAVAAAVVLAFLVWPRGASATPVKASSFAGVYRHCARGQCRNRMQVGGGGGCKGLDALCQKAGFACKMPDVAACGRYRVDGGCCCSPCKGVRVLHVYFRAEEPPNEVVSAFTVDRRIKLCADDGSSCAGCKSSQRRYHAAADGDVVVVGWDDGDRSYVLVGQMNQQQLVRLADGIALTGQLDPERAPASNPACLGPP